MHVKFLAGDVVLCSRVFSGTMSKPVKAGHYYGGPISSPGSFRSTEF